MGLKKFWLLQNQFRVLLACALAIGLLGCASDGSRGLASDSGYESNAHPAAYVTDRFPVNRPLPAHKPSNNAEFYFKRCEMTGANWPYSRTSYDCEYP